MNVWSSLNETLICVNEILIVQTTSLGYIHAWNIISLAIFVWVSISSKICIDDVLIWIVHMQRCTHLCYLLWQTPWTFKSKRLHCASCAINIKKRFIKQYIPKINSKVCIYIIIYSKDYQLLLSRRRGFKSKKRILMFSKKAFASAIQIESNTVWYWSLYASRFWAITSTPSATKVSTLRFKYFM